MLTVLAFSLAVAAAVRSTWSPCGLSMLSTVTPIAERGRGHRFAVTATWFVVGSRPRRSHPRWARRAGRARARRAVDRRRAGRGRRGSRWSARAIDAGVAGVRPPFFKRQLDDAWLDRYRGWVYGLGFGWQIGVGFATYIMTTAVPVTALLAALTGSPADRVPGRPGLRSRAGPRHPRQRAGHHDRRPSAGSTSASRRSRPRSGRPPWSRSPPSASWPSPRCRRGRCSPASGRPVGSPLALALGGPGVPPATEPVVPA